MILKLITVIGYIIAAGWIYYLTARVQTILSHVERLIDEQDQARGPIAPELETVKPTPHPRAIVTPVPPNTVTRISARAHDEPITEPIEAQPATVPSHAVIADQWQQEQDVSFAQYLAQIRGDA